MFLTEDEVLIKI